MSSWRDSIDKKPLVPLVYSGCQVDQYVVIISGTPLITHSLTGPP